MKMAGCESTPLEEMQDEPVSQDKVNKIAKAYKDGN